MILLVGEDDLRGEALGLLEIHLGISHDNDDIAHLHLACGGAIEADASAVAGTLDDIRVEAFAVHIVDNIYAFACNESGGIHQCFIDGDTAHVIQVRLGDRGAMNLGFQYFYRHRDF